jgi:transposase
MNRLLFPPFLEWTYQVASTGKKATIAIGHTLLVIVYHVLADEKDYEELGGNYFDDWERQAVQKRLVRRLKKLGYQVTLTPTEPAV